MVPLKGVRGDGGGQWDGMFASLTTLIAVLALARNFLPQEWVRAVRRMCYKLTDYLNPYVVYHIPEFSSESSAVEQVYEKARRYLSGRGTDSAHRISVNHFKNTSEPTFTLVRG